MNPGKITLITTLALLALFVGKDLHSQDEANTSQEGAAPAWEHLMMPVPHERRLDDPKVAAEIDRLGNAGWQLVDVDSRTKMGNTVMTNFFFKRPK